MNKDNLKIIEQERYKLCEKITNNINKGLKDKNTKDMVIEYHRLTKILVDEGINASIKLDYLQLEYWDNISDNNEEYIKKLNSRRTSLKCDLFTNKDNPHYKEKAIKKIDELYNITKELKRLGKRVEDKAECLTYEFWEIIEETEKVKDKNKNQQKTIQKIQNKQDSGSKFKQEKYIISLAWTESNEYDIKDTINIIKNYFDNLDIKEDTYEKFKRNSDIEHIIRYEYIGYEQSFKILKYSAQYLLDTICKNDYEKFNIAIFGKQKEVSND